MNYIDKLITERKEIKELIKKQPELRELYNTSLLTIKDLVNKQYGKSTTNIYIQKLSQEEINKILEFYRSLLPHSDKIQIIKKSEEYAFIYGNDYENNNNIITSTISTENSIEIEWLFNFITEDFKKIAKFINDNPKFDLLTRNDNIIHIIIKKKK